MKYILISILCYSLNALALPNSIIAIVNDTVVTFDSISEQITKTTTKEEKIALLEQQIDLVLQMEKAQLLDIRPRPETINTMLINVAKQNGLTLEQLQANNKFDNIVSNVSQQLSLKGLEQYITQHADIAVTQKEINGVLVENPSKKEHLTNQVKIAQIVINSIDKADSLLQSQNYLIKQFLTKLSSQIKNGTSFSGLAKLHSQDPSYQNGGESDWLDLNTLPEIFQQNLANLKLNEVSNPFKTPQDWRLVKIINQRKIDTHLATIKAQLFQSKKNTYFQNWVKTLRENAYIETFEHKFSD